MRYLTGRMAWTVCFVFTLVICSGAAAEEGQLPAPRSRPNAALWYWRASALTEWPKDEDLRVAVREVALGERELDKAVANVLEQNSDTLQILRQASRIELCDFQIDYAKGFTAPLPHLSTLRDCSRLLAAEGKRCESRKEWSAAVDNYLAGIRMGAHVAQDEMLISSLVGAYFLRMHGLALRDCLGSMPGDIAAFERCRKVFRELPADVCNWTQALLVGEKMTANRQFDKVVEEDGIEALIEIVSFCGWGTTEVRKLFKGDLSADEVQEIADKLGMDATSVTDPHEVRKLVALYREQYNNVMDELVEVLNLPWSKGEKALELLEKRAAKIKGVAGALLPALTAAVRQKSRLEQTLRITELAGELAAYKADHGEYPPALADLPASAQQRSYRGKPFAYERTDPDSFHFLSMAEGEEGEWLYKVVDGEATSRTLPIVR